MQPTKAFVRLCLAATLSACAGSPPLSTAPNTPTVRAMGTGTAYHIDNRAGSGCSNAGPGTSTAQPWCDFTNVNARTFSNGERVLLARGATWNQELQLRGSGTAGNLNELGAYGSGAPPIITRNGNLGLRGGGTLERAVLLTNPSYWHVHDLEVSYAAVGIEAYYDTKGHDTLIVEDVYAHHIRGITEANLFYAYDAGKTPVCSPAQSNTFPGVYQSSGLIITGPYNLPITADSNDYVLKNLTVKNFEGSNNLTSVAIQFCNVLHTTDGAAASNAVQNARFVNLYLHDDDGGGSSEGCMQSLSILNTLNSHIYNSRIERAAGCFAYHGTIAVLFSANKNLTFANNIIASTQDTGSGDQGGIDFEYRNEGVKTYNNYFTNNSGSGIEFLAIRTADFSRDHDVAGNAFKNNGADPTPPPSATFSRGAMSQAGNGFVPSGVIRDNVYFETDGLLSHGDFSGFSTSNNRPALAPNRLTFAAADFSNVQGQEGWSYQSNAGQGWSDLPYASATERWSGSGGFPWMDRFNTHPNSCVCWTARVWSAPVNGLVSLRGRAFKAEVGGDGVQLRVTRNDAVIWGPVSIAGDDQAGRELVLDGVAVSAGDALRFEVNAGGANDSAYDWVSWTPAVAYTALTSLGGNLSPAAVASASSTDTGNGYAASKVNDGVASTDWSGWANAYQAVLPQWVQLEWTSTQTVNRVEVYSTTGYEVRDFDLQYWDGGAWTTLASVRDNTANHRSLRFASITTGKLRVVGLSGPSQQPGIVRFNEVETYNDPNLSPAAAASASSTDTGNGYAASKVNDGVASTDWSGWANAYQAALPQWVQLEWSSAKVIGRVELYTTTGYELRDYNIEYWNGTSWTALVTVNGNTANQRSHGFEPVSTTKIRVLGRSGPTLQPEVVRVNELQAY